MSLKNIDLDKANQVSGNCPKCDSNDLDYKEWNGNSYPFTCSDCGVEGYEYYNMEFSHTELVE